MFKKKGSFELLDAALAPESVLTWSNPKIIHKFELFFG